MQRWREPREPSHRSSGQPCTHGPARLSALVYPLKVCKLPRHWACMPRPGLCQKLLHIPRCSLRDSRDTHQLACVSYTIGMPYCSSQVCTYMPLTAVTKNLEVWKMKQERMALLQ